MRRPSQLILILGLVLAFCTPAFCGGIGEILLGGSSGSPVKFTANGTGGFTVNFDILNLAATGTGNAFGNGALFGTCSGGSACYSIINNGAVVSMGAGCGTDCYMLNQSAPMLLKIGSTAGGSDFLLGQLTLVDIVQSGQAGTFNDALKIDLKVTGGSLQPDFFNNNGVVQLTIKFKTNENLAMLLSESSGQNITAQVTHGAIIPVPESGTLTLLGFGLLGLAWVCRKKGIFV